jgi:hypothetical protein
MEPPGPQVERGEQVTVTAELLALPGIRLLPVQRLSLERRKKLLSWLAKNLPALPAEAVTVMRDTWSHDSLSGPHLDEAWCRYLERLALADAVDAGIADWDWRCNSCAHLLGRKCSCLCCPSASGQAHQDAGDALEYLAAGAL